MGDPRLRPPGHALVSRGIVRNVRGYRLYSNYARPNPAADLIEGARRGEVDVAVVWRPMAGYFAALMQPRLTVTPVEPDPRVPFEFAISMGVRPAIS